MRWAFWLLFPAVLSATDITVRLFWLHPPASVKVSGNGPWTLEAPGTPRLVLSWQPVVRNEGGHALVTVKMPLEEYVAGVLAGESSVFRSEEALKAMAVTARSYAFRNRGRHRAEGFDFCDTTHCQDLRLAARNDRLRAAVEATESELLWYGGAVADAYYSRHCGGTTEAAQYVWPELRAPYLKQQIDTFCISTGRADWQCELRKQDLGGPVAILGRTPSGRVAAVRVGNRRMSATDFQLAVGRALGWNTIRSNFYDVSDHGDTVVFRGYGAGHGVGLCQVGAEQRGTQKQTYRQILAFYFPGTAVGVSAQGFSWTRLDGERVEAYSTRPNEDRDVIGRADRALREAEQRTGIRYEGRPRLRVYPTVAAFRDATGESGDVAASTLGRTVRMEPPGLLRSSGRLEATLLHEMLHVVLESQAHTDTPEWFREGLARYFAGPDGTRERARVRALIDRNGRERVMEWLRTGSPELRR
jgi:stage II sporulation protein D